MGFWIHSSSAVVDLRAVVKWPFRQFELGRALVLPPRGELAVVDRFKLQ